MLHEMISTSCPDIEEEEEDLPSEALPEAEEDMECNEELHKDSQLEEDLNAEEEDLNEEEADLTEEAGEIFTTIEWVREEEHQEAK